MSVIGRLDEITFGWWVPEVEYMAACNSHLALVAMQLWGRL
jgi:hypothetical protein